MDSTFTLKGAAYMDIENIYPLNKSEERILDKIHLPVQNLTTVLEVVLLMMYTLIHVGGLVIASWGIWILWSLVFAPPLTENNVVTFMCRLLTYICVLIASIGLFTEGFDFMHIVLWIISGCIAALTVIFLINKRIYCQSIIPMLKTIVMGLTANILYIPQSSPDDAAVVVTFSLSAVLLIVFLLTLGTDIITEIRKYFHS